MPIYPENFVANALSGTILVTNGFANVTLPTNPFALEGDKNFVIKLRKGGINGLVIATSPTITVRDLSQFVSLTANVSTVAEGNLVSFTLVTANAADGSNVFYSVFPVTANVTASDFAGANVGKATIINNQATFALFANADYSLINETGETFRVQLRENSVTGNIIYNTSNVVITDFYKRVNVFGFTESARSISEGSSVTFTVSAHNIATGTLLYYYTSGNADISGSNIGSVAMNAVSNTITIATSPTIPANQSRVFNLVLSESNLGAPIATSNAITVVDAGLATITASGGTESLVGGYKIHRFTSSGTLVVTQPSLVTTAEMLVVAGGGGGGNPSTPAQGDGGGGGGGFVQTSGILLSSNLSVTIGAGGTVGANGSNSSITAANFANVLAIGGGRGIGSSSGPALPGGSGGGGGGAGWDYPGPTQQGFPGGSPRGGGGGASQAGFPTGKGGDGAPSLITGSNVFYAGGGAAGETNPRDSGQSLGGGGLGALVPQANGSSAGGTNTGGGGGGGSGPNPGPGKGGSAGGSGVVIIRYLWQPLPFFTSVTANTTTVVEGENAFFVVNTTFANASILYYDTVGSATSDSFAGGNTGSFTVTSNATVLRLQTIANIPANESRNFALRIREDSATGNIVLISSNVGIYDSAFFFASGGTETLSGGYKIHTFTTSGSFTVTSNGGGSAEILMVAGGGGGGSINGGGGGAGGLLYGNVSLAANTYDIVIGGGGAASAPGPATPNRLGGKGGNTTLGSFVALGGGGGSGNSAPYPSPQISGGSGGGAAAPQPAGGTGSQPPQGGLTGYGNPGGSSSGGGAGGAGVGGSANVGGGRGLLVTISSPNAYYANGGGGSVNTANARYVAGATNTGTGGAGSGPGLAGGSGIVIIRYPFA